MWNPETQLLRLQQMGMVREISRLPEPEYIFKHVIVQQVTYGSCSTRSTSPTAPEGGGNAGESAFLNGVRNSPGRWPTITLPLGRTKRPSPSSLRHLQRAKEIYAYEEALHFAGL